MVEKRGREERKDKFWKPREEDMRQGGGRTFDHRAGLSYVPMSSLSSSRYSSFTLKPSASLSGSESAGSLSLVRPLPGAGAGEGGRTAGGGEMTSEATG